VARLTIFEEAEDYTAFMRVVDETREIVPLPIYAMVVMSNHWHFVVWPETSDQVSEFFRRLAVMHTMRWRARFKLIPIQSDGNLLSVMRYVERNLVRANFVERAGDWKWSSASARLQCADERRWLAIPEDPHYRKTGVHGAPRWRLKQN
jgi:putative transposase